MSATQIFIVAIAAVALVAAAAVFAVAFRRSAGSDGASLDPRAVRRDRAREREREREKVRVLQTAAGPAVVESEEETAEFHDEPVPDPFQERPEISREQFGVTRRQFFNRALLAVFGVFLAQFAIGFLAFFWPKLKAGGFGGKIDAGDVDDILAQINQADGTIAPLFVPAAQAYIVPFGGSTDGSSFEGIGELVVAGGLMALWQRCVHLGCRVPVCLPSQGFECPCHGSKYNFHGEYDSGPAPRNLDRFAVEVNATNRLIVDTGAIFQTARAKTKTIAYPQGPSCLSASTE